MTRGTVIASLAVLHLALGGQGLCGYCRAPTEASRPSCHESGPARHHAGDGHDHSHRPAGRDCCCALHDLCAVTSNPEAIVSAVRPATSVGGHFVALAPCPDSMTGLPFQRARPSGRASPLIERTPIYLATRSLRI